MIYDNDHDYLILHEQAVRASERAEPRSEFRMFSGLFLFTYFLLELLEGSLVWCRTPTLCVVDVQSMSQPLEQQITSFHLLDDCVTGIASEQAFFLSLTRGFEHTPPALAQTKVCA